MKLFIVVSALSLISFNFAVASDPVVSRENIESWIYSEYRDVMTDKVRYVARTSSDDQNALVLACDAIQPKSVYAYFVTSKFLGDGNRFLNYRVDDNKAGSIFAEYDKHSADVFDHSKVAPFIERLRNGHAILIRATTFDNDTVEAKIDIGGVDKIIDRLRKDCQD